MENEYRERQEPKVRYEQYETENPMDAVRGKNPKRTEEKSSFFSRKKKTPEAEEAPKGNEFREREPEFTKGGSKRADNDPAGKTAGGKKLKKDAVKRPNLFVQVLNGDILTRDFVLNNLTFIFFLLFLLLLMVAKGYYGKQLAKDIDTEDTEVRAKTAEYIENKARLEESTARYRLVEALEKRGLKETVNPAKVIRLKPNENE